MDPNLILSLVKAIPALDANN